MGSHIRRMDPSEPPWLLNQSVKLTLSNALTLRMPPSGSTSALTIGEVPNANELAACTQHKDQADHKLWVNMLSLCLLTATVAIAAQEQRRQLVKEQKTLLDSFLS